MSAVIPTCDRHDLLLETVLSVCGQSSPPDDIIVVDNGYAPVAPASLPGDVRLVQIEAGAGVSAARNAGVAASECEYVAFLDDDDRWDVTYLDRVRDAIARSDARPDLVIGRKHREVGGVVTPYKMIDSLDGLRSLLLYMNPGVGGQNLTVRRQFHLELGGFRAQLRASEDRAYLIDAIDRQANICLEPTAIAVKVMHGGPQLTDGRRRIRNVLAFSRVYWRSMERMQRIDNTRKVLYALRGMARARSRPVV